MVRSFFDPTSAGNHTPESVRMAVEPVLTNWPIQKAWLFGSVSRGTQTTGSDIDIAVLPCEGAYIGLGISQIQWDLEDALECEVDVIVLPLSSRYPKFAAEYERDKVLIYERKE